MKVSAKGGTQFAQAPAGPHVARCIALVDLGTQQREYQGKVSHSRQVWMQWELPETMIDEGEAAGKPYTVSAFFTASLSEKAKLRPFLEAWRGRAFTDEELDGFDLTAVLDKGCLLNVVTNEKGRSVVGGIMPLPKGTKCPPRVNELLNFDLDAFDKDAFDLISEGLQKMIMKSPEYAEAVGIGRQHAAPSGDADDIPF